jgi:dienelactone hydrolase
MMNSINAKYSHKKLGHIIVIFIACALFLNCGGAGSPAAENGNGGSPEEPKVEFPREKAVMVTDDDITIYGTFVYIEDNELHPAAILCHQFRRDRSSYEAFQTLLAENGICSLAIDFRGFGESTDNGLSFSKFKDKDYIDMVNDIEAALNFLTDGPGKDRVDAEKIGLVGASIGANLAIMAGAQLEGLACTAALSPGRSWHGLQSIPYAPDVKIPAFIAYADTDKQSAEVITDLVQAFGGNKPVVIVLEGKSHGTDMLADDLDKNLLNWLKEKLAQ